MELKFRKQYSAAYQVFEVEVTAPSKDQVDAILARMDEMAKVELPKMVAIASANAPAPKTFEKKEYTTPYTPKTTGYSAPSGGYSKPKAPGAASVKQIDFLKDLGVTFDPATITSQEASDLITQAKEGGATSKPKATYTAPSNTAPVSAPTVDPYQEMGDNLPF